MKRISLAALACAVFIVGCGSSPPKKAKTAAPFVCVPVKHEMGECNRQLLEYEGVSPAQPSLPSTFGATLHQQGIDVSRYQGCPDWGELYGEGIRFAIVQVADNDFASNPYIACQINGAHAAHIAVGVYDFTEGASSISQAEATIAAAAPYRANTTLGAWVDAEIPEAYPRACETAHDLAGHFHIVGVYSSPGIYQGGRCQGDQWPAEWGSEAPYALPGYPSTGIELRQWCGTCTIGGVSGEVDRDEDTGVLALATPKPKPHPKPKPKLTHKQLEARLAELGRLLGAYRPYPAKGPSNIHGHDCARPPFHHPYPSAKYGPECLKWGSEAKRIRKQLNPKAR